MRTPTPLIALLVFFAVCTQTVQSQTLTPPPIRYVIGGTAVGAIDLTVSADGQTFATASTDSIAGGTVKVWRMSDAALLHTFVTTGTFPYCVALSPDSTTVSAGDGLGNVWTWRLADRTLIRKFTVCVSTPGVTTYGVYSLAYSPDGGTLAAASVDNTTSIIYTIKLFSTTDGSLQRTLTGFTGFVDHIAYGPIGSGLLASASADLTVRIWNADTGALLRTINAFTQFGANWVALSPDGKRVAAVGGDTDNANYVRVWNVADGSLVTNIPNSYNDHRYNVNEVAFSPDGTLLATAGQDDNVASVLYNSPKLFLVSTGALVNTFTHLAQGINSIAFSADGATLISAEEPFSNNGTQQILQWNTATGALTRTVAQITAPVTDAAFTADGSRMAIASGFYGVETRSVATGAILFPGVPGGSPISLSPDGTLLGCLVGGIPTIVNPVNGAVIRTLPSINDFPTLWFSADDQRFYTASPNGRLRAFRTRDGVQLSQTGFNAVLPAFSADGSRVAGYSGQVAIWNAQSGVIIQTIGVGGFSSNIALSSTGAYVAFGAGTDAFIYRVSDGMMMLDQPGAFDTTTLTVGLSPYGDSIAAYRSDGSVTVTAINGQTLAYWNDQLGTGLGTIRYSPDGASILLGRLDGVALLCYNPAPTTLIGLTLNEYTAFGGHDTPQGTVALSLPTLVSTPIALVSGNPAVASLPANIIIGQGASSVIVPITTKAVTTSTTVPISATYNGITLTVNLTVNPYVAPKALVIAPATVQGGIGAVGVVTLKGQASAGGITIMLSSSCPAAASTPSTVTIAAGQTSAHFPIQTGPVAATTQVTITAAEGNSFVNGKMNVDPAMVTALNLLPTSVQGGVENAVGIVTLAAPATADVTATISVTTAGTAGDVTYPASITIPAGASNGIFEIGTNAPKTASDKVTFMVQIGATSKTANLTVTR